MSKVLNMHHPGVKALIEKGRAVYIGRPPSYANQYKHFGNPFSHLVAHNGAVGVGSRDAAVCAFEEWIKGTNPKWDNVNPEQRLWVLAHLHELEGKDLACWCVNKDGEGACHGQVLLRLLSKDKTKD